MADMLTNIRWWLAKRISPYDVMAVGLTIKDGVLTLPAGMKNGVVEDCTFERMEVSLLPYKPGDEKYDATVDWATCGCPKCVAYRERMKERDD